MSKEYKQFMGKYNEEHKCCPKCGSERHTTTYVGYVLVRGEEENYKDKNKCVCEDCGDIHVKHDRIRENG